jgi:hypothetical protein
MPTLPGPFGVDFVLFDAEEYVVAARDPYFLGSTFFARQYAAGQQTGRQQHRYRCGVIVDMVADRDLAIWQERKSVTWPETRPIVEEIWAVAGRLGVPWHDTDSYFWLPTDPAYVTPRPMPDRLDRLARALDDEVGWVLSGSLDGWGDPLAPRIGTEIFLHVPQQARMDRLRAREAARFGPRIAPGGDMHAGSQEFLAWAESYDTAGTNQRSLARHLAWLAALPCPVLRLDGGQPAGAVLAAALAGLGAPAPAGG